ncbi:MAG: hypothetical protein A2X08_18270 [Bacteroidetes bacterium GWA2_32_17]|nr:MAG: hypothetical protein A2X08_18270 [Bacteroidetes bacterium GWA2_32_17]
MGTSCCCINPFDSFTNANWIALVGIAVNAILAFWIVRTIQNKLTNKRVLKDHFINEVKEIRNDYKNCLNNLYLNQTNAKIVIPWFKLINIKIDDLMILISQKYKKIDQKALNPYQNELRELITENEDFIKQYESGKQVNFSEISRNQFIKFQQKHNHLFNDIIIKINDAE